MKQYKYFSYSMNCICIGFFLIIANLCIVATIRFIISGVFFGNCYFPFYFFSEYEAILSVTDQDVTTIVRILGYIAIIEGLIGILDIFFWVLPLTVITINIWLKFAYMKMKGKSSVQFRYNLSRNFV